ncbi:hypothetical protein SAMN04487948_11715 [Halogranum amylolyticum]|uniref:Uncharacterized protein n=1 Tax=Halogranum amylolyticum TaxID=660520 RepID=A0A1H8VK20_9EURY|nr:hypothetical protein SAMN04487948_11715 [Halogranum amylolyticum]
MNFLFSSLIGGNLTLITVVISINQLLLSRNSSLRAICINGYSRQNSIKTKSNRLLNGL